MHVGCKLLLIRMVQYNNEESLLYSTRYTLLHSSTQGPKWNNLSGSMCTLSDSSTRPIVSS